MYSYTPTFITMVTITIRETRNNNTITTHYRTLRINNTDPVQMNSIICHKKYKLLLVDDNKFTTMYSCLDNNYFYYNP